MLYSHSSKRFSFILIRIEFKHICNFLHLKNDFQASQYWCAQTISVNGTDYLQFAHEEKKKPYSRFQTLVPVSQKEEKITYSFGHIRHCSDLLLIKCLHKNIKQSTSRTLFALIQKKKKLSLFHALPSCLIYPLILLNPANLTYISTCKHD